MAKLWDDVKKSLKEWGTIAADKAEELTKVGRIRLDILSIKRDIEKNFTELGGKVYHLVAEENQTRIAGNDEVKKIVNRILNLEEELNKKKELLESVKKEEEPPISDVKKSETEE